MGWGEGVGHRFRGCDVSLCIVSDRQTLDVLVGQAKPPIHGDLFALLIIIKFFLYLL